MRIGPSKRLCASYGNLRFYPSRCAKLIGTLPIVKNDGERIRATATGGERCGINYRIWIFTSFDGGR